MGSSTFPQHGCDHCTGGKGCPAWCASQANVGNFGWCARPNATSPDKCCACSAKALGTKAISPGHLIECNQNPVYWKPPSTAWDKDWKNNKLGGCNGGTIPMMIDMLNKRGAGTCESATGCATGCV